MLPNDWDELLLCNSSLIILSSLPFFPSFLFFYFPFTFPIPFSYVFISVSLFCLTHYTGPSEGKKAAKETTHKFTLTNSSSSSSSWLLSPFHPSLSLFVFLCLSTPLTKHPLHTYTLTYKLCPWSLLAKEDSTCSINPLSLSLFLSSILFALSFRFPFGLFPFLFTFISFLSLSLFLFLILLLFQLRSEASESGKMSDIEVSWKCSLLFLSRLVKMIDLIHLNLKWNSI